jgi:hypothetical protein
LEVFVRRTLIVLTLLALAALAPTAHASKTQEAMFQDDNRLIFNDQAGVIATLDELRALGVDRVRVSLFWRAVAPDADKDARPSFDATNPDAYGRDQWDRYDRLLRLAQERGIAVNLNPTTPAPDWATGTPAREDIDETWEPDPRGFGDFVKAAATRYDGSHGHPRVDYWSLLNEPNQAGWLTPQWVQRGNRWVEAAPRLARELTSAAWQALQDTGHGGDTILVGELAPKGLKANRGETRSIDAGRFVRRLYCLDDNLQVLRGAAAEEQGCPTADAVRAFPAQHPALFRSTGFAHHPYELVFAPSTRPTWRDWFTMGNLRDLQSLLRRVWDRYGQPRNGDIPLYLTEFGYQTNPPDRFGVTPAVQAAYLNHAEFIAYRQASVRTLSQFLLTDGGEPVSRTFQSGLRFLNGDAKPSYDAYRMPIHIAVRTLRRGARMRVWGAARPAPDGQAVQIQFRRRGAKAWRTLATRAPAAGSRYVDTRLRAPGTGSVRLVWNELASRSVGIRVKAPRKRRARR